MLRTHSPYYFYYDSITAVCSQQWHAPYAKNKFPVFKPYNVPCCVDQVDWKIILYIEPVVSNCPSSIVLIAY